MAIPVRQKQPRQQLTKGMEHMRSYVTIDDTPAPTPPASTGEDAYGVPASYEPVRNPYTRQLDHNPEKRSDPFQFGTRYLAEGDDILCEGAVFRNAVLYDQAARRSARVRRP